MAYAPKLTVAELETKVKSILDKTDISVTNYDAVKNAVVNLVNKIGMIFTNEQEYKDKLATFDRETMRFGSTIEEYQYDIQLPMNYSTISEVEDLKSHYPTQRPCSYSEPIEDQIFAVTRSFKDLQKAVNDEGQFAKLVVGIQQALESSIRTFKYGLKRDLIGKLAKLCTDAMNATAAQTWAAGTARAVNTLVKNADNKVGIVVKAYPASANLAWEPAIAAGYIVLLDLVATVKKPTDTATGEAFLKQIKADVETAGDISEGHSLNGNTLGASEYVLLVKHGITNVLDVDVQAGAFNGDKVAIPAEIISVPDFGKDAPANVYAVLMDKRTLAVFPTFEYRGESENVTGGFINYIAHYEAVPVISRNTFVKVYKSA